MTMGLLGATAGPIAVAVVYARQVKRNPDVSGKSVRVAQSTLDAYETMPARWFHYLLASAFLAMPFVQYFWYIREPHWIAVILPLAVVAILLVMVNVFSPRAIRKSEPAGQGSLLLIVVGAGLLIALALPRTGTLLMLQGALTDIFGLMLASSAIPFQRARSSASSSA